MTALRSKLEAIKAGCALIENSAWYAEEAPADDVFEASVYGKRGSFDVLIAEVMDADEAAHIARLDPQTVAEMADLALEYLDLLDRDAGRK